MIVDFHTHVDHAEVYGWFDPPEKLLALLDAAGVAKAAIMTYLDHPLSGADPIATIADAMARYPDRLIGFVRLNPNFRAEARRALDRCITELGFKGVKLHPTTTLAHPRGMRRWSSWSAAASWAYPCCSIAATTRTPRPRRSRRPPRVPRAARSQPARADQR